MTAEEQRIYSMAFSEIVIGKKYRSPFREDRNPSFSFFVNNRSGRLWWVDWGTGEKGNCYDFHDRYTGNVRSATSLKLSKEEKKPCRIEHGEITKMAFWRKYGISKETLSVFNVKQVNFVNDRPMELSYIYFIENGRYKVYSPKQSRAYGKWWGSMKRDDIFGIEQLPENGKLLILTKSLKDIMVLREMGYNAIAYASETTTPIRTKTDPIFQRFKKVIILYDNDEAGVTQSTKLSAKYGIEKVYMKSAKDISDCVEKIGFDEAKKEFEEQIKNLNG